MITFSEKQIVIDGKAFDLEYTIVDAFEFNNLVVVLFDPDDYTLKFGQFANLLAINAAGKHIWTAELPTTASGDRYYKIASKQPLIVYSVCSYECEIDCATGRIVKSTFFK